MLEYLRAWRRSSASLPPGVAFIQRRVIDTDVDDTLLGKWLRDTVRWIFSGEGNKDKSSGEMQQCSRCMDFKKKKINRFWRLAKRGSVD